MDFEEQMKWLWENPPSCISGLIQQKPEDLSNRQIEDGNNSTKYNLQSPSGKRDVCLFFRQIERDGRRLEGPPAYIADMPDSERTVIFDHRFHGFDGEIGNFHKYRDEVYEDVAQFFCRSCGHGQLNLIASFQHDVDAFPDIFDFEEDESPPDSPEWQRRQDFFGWYFLNYKCPKCGEESWVFDFECA